MATQLDITQSVALRDHLHRLMERPQRHRLLHGYPLAAAMPYLDKSNSQRRARISEMNVRAPVPNSFLVGVLPHPFCNPKLAGCGCCTFPHETFGTGSWETYRENFELFCAESLMVKDGETFRLTPQGMFYSDALASMLARQRWQESPGAQVMSALNDNRAGHM